MDLDTIDILICKKEDEYKPMYRPPSTPNRIKHRALRCGDVVWIIRDGKATSIQNIES